MKSRISFFDVTVFKKNLTRFAPAWALYGVFLVMCLLVMSGNLARDLRYVPESMAIVNLLYAMLVALLLFGDLYNPRMCNAIHAMPVRRESLFVTNILSGLSFSLIPTLAAMVVALGLCNQTNVENGMLSPLLTFAAANLQYLFFFGTAVLCAFLVGSRFAMALVYTIVNFASLLVFWFVDTLYTPLLYGLKTIDAPFILLCPVVQIQQYSYINCLTNIDETSNFISYIIEAGNGWGYSAVCAAIGVAFLGLALLLYRRRKLECAGDFMAEKIGEPVFLVVYSLVMGCVFQFFWSIFAGGDVTVFLFVGMFVGFFTGLMLLKRTVRVFRPKAFLGCVLMMLAMGLSLIITVLDPFGIENWMPQANQVESVTLYQNHSLSDSPGEVLTLEDPESIEAILRVHKAALNQDQAMVDSDGWVLVGYKDEKVYLENLRSINIALEYRMKNGSVVRRYYSVWTNTEAGNILKNFFTSVECVLGVPESELVQLAQDLDFIMLDSYQIYNKAEMLSFLQAVAADCNAGTMAQNWAFRNNDETLENIMDIQFVQKPDYNISRWYYIQVFNTNENILNWMKAHNVPTYQDWNME